MGSFCRFGEWVRSVDLIKALDESQGGESNRRILPPGRQVHGESRREFPREIPGKPCFALWTLCELGVLAVKFFNLQKTLSSPWNPSRA
jgi:hypothetical protein